MKKTLRLLGLATATALSFAAEMAHAAPPPTMAGVWVGVGNQTPIRLRVSQPGVAGTCRVIVGTMENLPAGAVNSNIAGFYCPATGRFNFLRKSLTTNDASQVYSGNVGDDAATDRLSGTFAAVASGGGTLGEYNFSFTR